MDKAIFKNFKFSPAVAGRFLGPFSPYWPLIGSVVLGLSAVALIALPRILSLPTLQAELGQKNRQLELYREKNIKLADLLSHSEVLQTDLSLVDSALTDNENVPELLAQIEKIASESGVSVRSLHFGIKTPGAPAGAGRSPYQAVELQTEADGSYANIQNFLINLENASRLTFVDSLRFSQEAVHEATLLRASLTLEAYYVAVPNSWSLDRPVTLNLSSPALSKVLEFLKPLRVYRVAISSGGAGKLNPFE